MPLLQAPRQHNFTRGAVLPDRLFLGAALSWSQLGAGPAPLLLDLGPTPWLGVVGVVPENGPAVGQLFHVRDLGDADVVHFFAQTLHIDSSTGTVRLGPSAVSHYYDLETL